MENNLFLVDWLSFRCDCMDFYSMADFLGLGSCEWSPGAGFYGYRFRMWFSGISIHYGNEKVEGVLVEMSGTGCRAFESFSELCDWPMIFLHILNDEDFSVTRLDIAFDDHEKIIPIKKIFSDVGSERFVSRFKNTSITREDHPGRVGQTIYLGSAQSEIRFRIYDKAYERGYDSDVHWVRFEMQLRRDMAHNFIDQLHRVDYNVGQLFASVVTNYFRFVIPPKSGADSNKRRWRTAPYWERLIDDVLPLSLWKRKDLEYNKAACEQYVYHQAGNSIAALIQIDGVEKFVENLNKKRNKKVPTRIQNMIATEKALAHRNGDQILEVLNAKA